MHITCKPDLNDLWQENYTLYISVIVKVFIHLARARNYQDFISYLFWGCDHKFITYGQLNIHFIQLQQVKNETKKNTSIHVRYKPPISCTGKGHKLFLTQRLLWTSEDYFYLDLLKHNAAQGIQQTTLQMNQPSNNAKP